MRQTRLIVGVVAVLGTSLLIIVLLRPHIQKRVHPLQASFPEKAEVQAVQMSTSYFPIEVGTTWEFDQKNFEKTVIVKTEPHGESFTIQYENEKNGKMVPSAQEMLSPDGLFRLVSYFNDGSDPLRHSPPRCDFKIPAEPGTQWTYESQGIGSFTTSLIGKAEQITVPIGTFMAIPVRTKTRNKDGALSVIRLPDWTGWYVRGIGLVKAENENGKTFVLKSFTLGKD
jgi:hypothetical protein